MVPYGAEKAKNRASDAFHALSEPYKKFLLQKGYRISEEGGCIAFGYSQRGPDSSRYKLPRVSSTKVLLVAGYMGHCNPLTKKYERDAAMRMFQIECFPNRSIKVRYFPLADPQPKMSQSMQEETGVYHFGPPNSDGSYGVPFSDDVSEKRRFFEVIDVYLPPGESVDSDSDDSPNPKYLRVTTKRPRPDCDYSSDSD